MKHYQDRSPMGLDIAGNFYSDHVSAMTREGLHSKTDIADELAVRDAQIDYLCEQLTYHTNMSLAEWKEDLPQFLLGED